MLRQEGRRKDGRIRRDGGEPIEGGIAWLIPLPVLLVASLGDPAAHIRTVLGLVAVWTLLALRARPPTLPALLALTLLLRVTLWVVSPTLSDDLWRYAWEGRVWAAGFNPLVHPPDDPVLTSLRDSGWSRVNHRSVPSVYPPLAQAWFVLLHNGGPLAFRAGASLADLLTVVLLYRRAPRAGTLWGLLPLPVLESAVSGHLEALGSLALVAGLGGRPWAAWLGALIKLLPMAVLLRLPWRQALAWLALTAGCLGALLAPAWSRGLATYAEKWSYNGSLFPLLRLGLGEAPARAAVAVIALAVVVGIVVRSRNPARVALWAMGAFVLCSPTVHPWYALWPLAVGLWAGAETWIVLGALIPVAYVVLDGYDPVTSRWEEPLWTRWLIWLPVWLHLVHEGWRRLTRPGPWPVD